MKPYILGLFAGDGWFEKRGISIGTKHEWFATKIRDILTQQFQRNVVMKKRKFSDGHELFIVSIHSKDLCNEFKQLLSTDKNKSKTFDFPKLDSQEDVRKFVAGLFDAEGYFYIWRGTPRAAMQIFNEKASEKIVNTLRSDGIKASLSRTSDGGFRIDVTSKKNTDVLFALYPFIKLSSSTGKS